MAKKSTVKSVQGTGTWKNREGKEFYKYEVEMENGDTGEYSSISDSQEKFIEGKEVEYNYTGGDYPKIKPYYSNPTSSNYSYSVKSNDDEQIARSVGLKAATELGVAQGLELAEILETAKIMADFIIKDKTVAKEDNNDMPF
tara:strand:+ start:291 stop:716 length:426 start_codon:yes stop_codon:yes gene_type:complete